MVASIKHVSHHVLGTEGDEYTPWSWLPPAHQHKPPCPRTNTKSAQSLATHHCGQKHSAESTGIAGSGHSMYRRECPSVSPPARKDVWKRSQWRWHWFHSFQVCEYCPVNWELCFWWNTSEKSLYPILLSFTFSTNQSPKVTNGWSWFKRAYLGTHKIPFHLQSHLYLETEKRKLKLLVNTHVKQVLTLNTFWIQLK